MIVELAAPTIIDKPAALVDLASQLGHESLIGVDTESNSLFAYREQVCLIQISTRTRDWLVDPLAIKDLRPLAPIFADARIEKVFHAAEYDLICLKRDYGFQFANLFDTMVAARIIGLKSIGLGSLLESYFGVSVDKRFQRADWSIRPIPEDQMRYAQQDTHYLPALYDILCDQLTVERRDVEAREVFEGLTQVQAGAHTFDRDGFWRIHAAKGFNRRQYAMLRELYLVRELLAEQRNRPPFKIFTDSVLVNIVTANPQTLKDLSAVPGMSHGQLERYGSKILHALRQGMAAPLPTRPDRGPQVDSATMARFDVLHEWRKARASERGVESDVILPKDTLWALARSAPRSLTDLDAVPGLGPWKREKYGQELLALLNATDQS